METWPTLGPKHAIQARAQTTVFTIVDARVNCTVAAPPPQHTPPRPAVSSLVIPVFVRVLGGGSVHSFPHVSRGTLYLNVAFDDARANRNGGARRCLGVLQRQRCVLRQLGQSRVLRDNATYKKVMPSQLWRVRSPVQGSGRELCGLGGSRALRRQCRLHVQELSGGVRRMHGQMS